MPSCMRAPPLEVKRIAGHAPLGGPVDDPGHLLAHHRAHRAAHELEGEGADGDRLAVDGPDAGDEGVAQPGALVGGLEPVLVLLGVGEAERVLAGVSSASSSSKVPGSSTSSKRRRAGRTSWWPQRGQTFQFFSHSARGRPRRSRRTCSRGPPPSWRPGAAPRAAAPPGLELLLLGEPGQVGVPLEGERSRPGAGRGRPARRRAATSRRSSGHVGRLAGGRAAPGPSRVELGELAAERRWA